MKRSLPMLPKLTRRTGMDSVKKQKRVPTTRRQAVRMQPQKPQAGSISHDRKPLVANLRPYAKVAGKIEKVVPGLVLN